jgi:hypothetical protein
VLWSNFRRLGFCNSSDFSSLEDFADYFANVPVPSVQIAAALDFHFVILVSSNVFCV